MASMHVDDFGGTITMTVKDRGTVKNISAATLKQIVVRHPNGTVDAPLAASFVTDGSDGKIVVTIADGLLDAGGKFDFQAIITTGSTSKFHSEWVSHVVKPNLAA
jgi:hypothetical protein